jgi:antitoxin (DNA-binding transcriptional repressor) of toxin-antitoxin stability system
MSEAEAQFSRLVERACAGEDVVIARNGKPAVRLVPVTGEPPRLRPAGGKYAAEISIKADFEDPLPDNLAKAFT